MQVPVLGDLHQPKMLLSLMDVLHLPRLAASQGLTWDSKQKYVGYLADPQLSVADASLGGRQCMSHERYRSEFCH